MTNPFSLTPKGEGESILREDETTISRSPITVGVKGGECMKKKRKKLLTVSSRACVISH